MLNGVKRGQNSNKKKSNIVIHEMIWNIHNRLINFYLFCLHRKVLVSIHFKNLINKKHGLCERVVLYDLTFEITDHFDVSLA